ncbi:MAG: thioredoxin-disulfide reductase [Anaerovoracaceae bacterium]
MLYDVIIVGGGPAGYTAALYCARGGLQTLILEKLSPGGQMATTENIDNYPGFDIGIDGLDLAEKMQIAAENAGAITEFDEVTGVELEGEEKVIHGSLQEYRGKTVILATGAAPRRMGIPREEDLLNRGVAYCATCDGRMYKDKVVAVIGGGNSAAADALILSKLCKKVYIIHRKDKLKAAHSYLEPLKKAENIQLIFNGQVEALVGEEKLEAIQVKVAGEEGQTQLACDGLFIAIGRVPNTRLFAEGLNLDPQGYVIADETTKTNIPGVFAAGDLRTKPLRQVVTAAADGATASKFAEEYLNGR